MHPIEDGNELDGLLETWNDSPPRNHSILLHRSTALFSRKHIDAKPEKSFIMADFLP